MFKNWLKKLSNRVDPLIESDFKILSKRGKRQLSDLIRLTDGNRNKIFKNLDDIMSVARGLQFTIEELNELEFDHNEALKLGKVKLKYLKK